MQQIDNLTMPEESLKTYLAANSIKGNGSLNVFVYSATISDRMV